ncbi:hypothetical protein K1719_023530 [Acacia pycnantha]|nr:hypothetical protein K1719_023530 [Acacia pycnantha]
MLATPVVAPPYMVLVGWMPELYKETNREDPKAVLDGVAVAGLVGILRQLGDLAEDQRRREVLCDIVKSMKRK